MRQAVVKVYDTEAGILTETDEHRYRFVYHTGYSGTPVSLTMPITEEIFEYDTFPPFSMVFCPKVGNWKVLLRFRKIDRHDYFSQLIAIGEVTIFEK